jgi:hypothetical protein
MKVAASIVARLDRPNGNITADHVGTSAVTPVRLFAWRKKR